METKDLHYQDGEDRTDPAFNPLPPKYIAGVDPYWVTSSDGLSSATFVFLDVSQDKWTWKVPYREEGYPYVKEIINPQGDAGGIPMSGIYDAIERATSEVPQRESYPSNVEPLTIKEEGGVTFNLTATPENFKFDVPYTGKETVYIGPTEAEAYTVPPPRDEEWFKRVLRDSKGIHLGIYKKYMESKPVIIQDWDLMPRDGSVDPNNKPPTND